MDASAAARFVMVFVAGAIAVATSPHFISPARGSSSVAGMSGMEQPAPPPPAIPDSASGAFTSGAPLAEPPLLRSRNGHLDVTLTARAQPTRISGKLVNARVYSAASAGHQYPASFVGPTMQVNPGDRLDLTVVDELGEETSMHTHGLFISPMGNSDNIYFKIPANKTATYHYDVPKDESPGTYWYHPHRHGLVEEQVFGGLSGLLQVTGLRTALPKRFRGVRERFLALKDLQVDRDNTIPATNIDSDKPTNRTVDGLIDPHISMRAGETQLWHVANIGADIWYRLQLPGLKYAVVEQDGNLVAKPWTSSALTMPPASRFDLLVQASKPGTARMVTQAMSTGPQGDHYPRTELMRVAVTGSAKQPAALPSRVRPRGAAYWEDLRKATPAAYRTFTLTENNQGFYINGKTFSQNRVAANPIKGTVEQWTFLNRTGEMHPIHIHVNDMQVLSINGKREPGTMNWVDTQPIPYMKKRHGRWTPGKVVVRMKFRRYTGDYVFHCHILAHEDMGMMANVSVTTPNAR